ncbi:MAG: FxDxF family PEP-CTERM protein [Burkholderiales bacterium]
MIGRFVKFFAAGLIALPATVLASVLQFNVLLNATNEVSSPHALNLGASGIGTLFYDTVSNTYDLTVAASGLSSAVTGQHIHAQATTSQNSGVIVHLTAPNGFDSGTLGATYFIGGVDRPSPGTIAAGNGHPAQSFLAVLQSGLAYINIHTTLRGSGEIRGQLVPVTAVPEPETYALLLAGLAVVGFAARRRRSV